MSADPRQAAGDARALDHYVLQVHDVDAAGASFERLGFQVRPRMTHIEFGTCNRVVQFRNTYLELLGGLAAAPSDIVREYLPRFECGEGLSHISLRSYDLEADRRAAAESGLSPGPITSARREVVMPDDSVEETDSSFFYMWRRQRLYLSLFLSGHNKPHTIWIPEYQEHPNTAVDTTGVTFVSDDPLEDRDYFSQIYRCAPTAAGPDMVRLTGHRGDVAEVWSRTRIHERYPGLELDLSDRQPGYPIGLTVSVRALDRCRAALADHGVACTVHEGAVLVPPQRAHGAVIEFVSA
ncbi:MAG: VOC family protein [Gammaproteobacteria bacterium]|nr:VOC family protein [Gammaproteobacteria bacterium]